VIKVFCLLTIKSRGDNKEYSQFLSIALESIAELDTQLIITKNLAYFEEAKCKEYSLQLASLRNRTLGLKRVIDVKA
jgi:four helix bundle protein